jgi:hypothetical protein
VQARYDELQKRFVDQWHETIGPLLVGWFEQPTRKLSKEIGEVCERFNARALREFCEPHGYWSMSIDLVASSFADVLLPEHPKAVNAFQEQGFGLGQTRYSQIMQTLPRVTKVAGPALYEQLEKIEAAFRAAAVARSTGPVLPESVRRYEVKRNTATARDLVIALAALEKTIEAERIERFEKDYASRGVRIIS